jgi:hypothetical protein
MVTQVSQVEIIADDDRVVELTVVEDQLGELIVIEERLGELVGLDSPGAQISIGPQLSDSAPLPIGTASSGSANSSSRSDHIHAHGSQPGAELHALATRSIAGFLSPDEKQLLDDAASEAFADTLVKRDEFGRSSFTGIGLNEPLSAISGGTGNGAYIKGDTLAASGGTGLVRINVGQDSEFLIADNGELAGLRYTKLYDASVASDAEISGLKILPDFGSQNIITTGSATFGNTVVNGDLTVEGTFITISTENIEVTDKTITIGSVEFPSDITADGGGVVLKGLTDKTILWIAATGCWSFSDCIDVLNGSNYKISGQTVLSSTTLGSSVINSSLTSVGTITSGAWDDGTF